MFLGIFYCFCETGEPFAVRLVFGHSVLVLCRGPRFFCGLGLSRGETLPGFPVGFFSKTVETRKKGGGGGHKKSFFFFPFLTKTFCFENPFKNPAQGGLEGGPGGHFFLAQTKE